MDIKRSITYDFSLTQKEIDELYEALRKLDNYDYLEDFVQEFKNKLANYAE